RHGFEVVGVAVDDVVSAPLFVGGLLQGVSGEGGVPFPKALLDKGDNAGDVAEREAGGEVQRGLQGVYFVEDEEPVALADEGQLDDGGGKLVPDSLDLVLLTRRQIAVVNQSIYPDGHQQGGTDVGQLVQAVEKGGGQP